MDVVQPHIRKYMKYEDERFRSLLINDDMPKNDYDNANFNLGTGPWINFQVADEFNPIHNHNGVYSFVIWMNIPTDWNLQRDYSFNDSAVSNFEFQYVNILGEMESFTYNMGRQMEGTMVLFPSKLKHQVYPFYNCKEQRVSIAGNIHLKT